MSIDWSSVLIDRVGGIPSDLAANWVFHKYQDWQKRKFKTEYFTST